MSEIQRGKEGIPKTTLNVPFWGLRAQELRYCVSLRDARRGLRNPRNHTKFGRSKLAKIRRKPWTIDCGMRCIIWPCTRSIT
jgi:hypothetical protein